MGKKLSILLLALLLALSVPVYAEETGGTAATDPTDYIGPLDPVTGLPPVEDVLPENGDEVVLVKDVYGYDRKQNLYVNYVEKLRFYSNYPTGAVIPYGEAMSIALPAGMTSVLYHNGTAVSSPDLKNITAAGSYVLEFYMGSNSGSFRFPFQILSSVTNSVSEISLPAGFVFEYIKLGGEEYTSDYTNYLALMEDGDYEVRWGCEAIGKHYTLKFSRDTQAPTLSMPDVVDGSASGPVALTGMEAECYMVVTDEEGKSTTYRADTTVSQAGKYTVTVYDQAGNSTSYTFTIHFYLNLSAGVAILLLLAVCLGLYLYGRYIRKHPRVG